MTSCSSRVQRCRLLETVITHMKTRVASRVTVNTPATFLLISAVKRYKRLVAYIGGLRGEWMTS